MPKHPARCTEAEINRAAAVAVKRNMRVCIHPNGTIVLEPLTPQKTVDTYDEVSL